MAFHQIFSLISPFLFFFCTWKIFVRFPVAGSLKQRRLFERKILIFHQAACIWCHKACNGAYQSDQINYSASGWQKHPFEERQLRLLWLSCVRWMFSDTGDLWSSRCRLFFRSWTLCRVLMSRVAVSQSLTLWLMHRSKKRIHGIALLWSIYCLLCSLLI